MSAYYSVFNHLLFNLCEDALEGILVLSNISRQFEVFGNKRVTTNHQFKQFLTSIDLRQISGTDMSIFDNSHQHCKMTIVPYRELWCDIPLLRLPKRATPHYAKRLPCIIIGHASNRLKYKNGQRITNWTIHHMGATYQIGLSAKRWSPCIILSHASSWRLSQSLNAM